MGQDAVIVVDDRYYVLDHAWRYLLFDSGDSMTKHDALTKIEEFKKDLIEDVMVDADVSYRDVGLNWFTIAETIIKSATIDNVTFYPNNADEYCNAYPGGTGITDTHRWMDEKNIYKQLSNSKNAVELMKNINTSNKHFNKCLKALNKINEAASKRIDEEELIPVPYDPKSNWEVQTFTEKPSKSVKEIINKYAELGEIEVLRLKKLEDASEDRLHKNKSQSTEIKNDAKNEQSSPRETITELELKQKLSIKK